MTIKHIELASRNWLILKQYFFLMQNNHNNWVDFLNI